MITFRLLNGNPLYDYREACKVTQGITMEEKYFEMAKERIDDFNGVGGLFEEVLNEV